MPYSRPRFNRRTGTVFHAAPVRDWMERVRQAAREQLPAGYRQPDDAVATVMVLATPALTKAGRERKRIGDADNIAKAAIDGLQGVVFDDDKAVRCLTVVVGAGSDRPGLDIRIWWGRAPRWRHTAGAIATGVEAVVEGHTGEIPVVPPAGAADAPAGAGDSTGT